MKNLLRACAFATILAAPALVTQAAAAPAILCQPAPQPNAALRYWQAIHGVQTEDSQKLREAYTGPNSALTDEVKELLSKHRSEVNILIKASKMERCDFEVDYDEGFNAILPHLSPLRNSARILALDAQRAMSEGKPDEAAERLAAIFSMARHVCSDKLLISSLVGIAIESLAETNLQSMNDRLTQEGRADVLAALDKYDTVDPFGVRANHRVLLG